MLPLSNEQIEQVADRAARRAVEEWLVRMGIEAASPVEMQRDFAYLRRSRQLATAISRKVRLTAIASAFAILISAGLMLLRFWANPGGPN